MQVGKSLPHNRNGGRCSGSRCPVVVLPQWAAVAAPVSKESRSFSRTRGRPGSRAVRPARHAQTSTLRTALPRYGVLPPGETLARQRRGSTSQALRSTGSALLHQSFDTRDLLVPEKGKNAKVAAKMGCGIERQNAKNIAGRKKHFFNNAAYPPQSSPTRNSTRSSTIPDCISTRNSQFQPKAICIR